MLSVRFLLLHCLRMFNAIMGWHEWWRISLHAENLSLALCSELSQWQGPLPNPATGIEIACLQILNLLPKTYHGYFLPLKHTTRMTLHFFFLTRNCGWYFTSEYDGSIRLNLTKPRKCNIWLLQYFNRLALLPKPLMLLPFVHSFLSYNHHSSMSFPTGPEEGIVAEQAAA